MKKNGSTEALSQWLTHKPWTWFGTFTTKYTLTVSSARRIAEAYHRRITKTLPGAEMFWVAEPFDCKEGYHVHALCNSGGTLFEDQTFDVYRKDWRMVSQNGRVHLSRYDEGRGAGSYVAKYITKIGSDYDYIRKKDVAVKKEAPDESTAGGLGRSGWIWSPKFNKFYRTWQK